MKRKFSSYGPIDTDIHYYVPRSSYINQACEQLLGETPEKGGHYFTVWAPRQTGKTWIFNQTMFRLQDDERFYTIKIEMQIGAETFLGAANFIISEINREFSLSIPEVESEKDFYSAFTDEYLSKPLILILDEFDDLGEAAIRDMVRTFRNLYVNRNKESRSGFERRHRLHGLALMGVRSVMGVDNKKGSPFNVQRSMHIPNLTYDEVQSMYRWYEQDSGQTVEPGVVDRLYYETNGQPGLVSWFGELLTEMYNENPEAPITIGYWRKVFSRASQVLPNNTVMNISSKAQDPEYKETVLKLFQTSEKMQFSFDEPHLNYLYMNGVISYEEETSEVDEVTSYAKFSSPFIQKRLFNRFSQELFEDMQVTTKPFEDLSDSITEESLDLKNTLMRYEHYLHANKHWLLKDAPRRVDGRVYEAFFHFNLYRFLSSFFDGYPLSVTPEFPTGNGKVDLLLQYKTQLYALELKSFSNRKKYQDALLQAARYAKTLGLKEITLAVFMDYLDDNIRQQFEVPYYHPQSQVQVNPVFVAIVQSAE